MWIKRKGGKETWRCSSVQGQANSIGLGIRLRASPSLTIVHDTNRRHFDTLAARGRERATNTGSTYWVSSWQPRCRRGYPSPSDSRDPSPPRVLHVVHGAHECLDADMIVEHWWNSASKTWPEDTKGMLQAPGSRIRHELHGVDSSRGHGRQVKPRVKSKVRRRARQDDTQRVRDISGPGQPCRRATGDRPSSPQIFYRRRTASGFSFLQNGPSDTSTRGARRPRAWAEEW